MTTAGTHFARASTEFIYNLKEEELGVTHTVFSTRMDRVFKTKNRKSSSALTTFITNTLTTVARIVRELAANPQWGFPDLSVGLIRRDNGLEPSDLMLADCLRAIFSVIFRAVSPVLQYPVPTNCTNS